MWPIVLSILVSVPMIADLPAYFTFRPRPDQPERYDQQTAFYESKLPGVAWLIGGNGAGTTEVTLAKVAKFVFETPPPRHDTPFWVLSEDYPTVMETAWKEKLYGHGHIPACEVDWERVSWYKPNQGWPFRVPLKPWPDRPGKNWVLEFKAYGQGRQRLQGRSIGGFCFIEQFPWGLLEEVLRGCREYNFPGSKFCEFTPIDPNLSAEIEEMIETDTLPDGWQVFRANTECAKDAGHVSEVWFNEFFGMIPEEMRLTRMTGHFATYEGAVYKTFNPLVHLTTGLADNMPPNIFHRRAIDWGGGPDNAFCCLWAYKNGLGQWFFYDEYYSTDQDRTTVDHLCEAQDRWPWPEKNPHYGNTYADPSDPDNIRIASKLSQYTEGRENIPIVRARNAVIEGIEHVQWLLKPQLVRAEGEKPQPRIFIDRERCPNLARQMRTYRWIRGSENSINPRDAKKEPLKKDDHAVDAMRYLVFSEAYFSGLAPSSQPRQRSADRHGVHLAGRT